MSDDYERLFDQLEAFDENSRKLALQILGDEGTKVLPYCDRVVKLLQDEEPEVRRVAASTIPKILAPALFAAAPSSRESREAASERLAAARSLVRTLADGHPSVRAEAAKAIGELGPEVRGVAAEKVAQMVKDRDEDALLAAVACLAALEEASKLWPFAQSPVAAVRRLSLLELGRCPEALALSPTILLACLRDQDASVRLAAAQASGELGSLSSASHLDALCQLRTYEKQAKVRRTAVLALGKLGGAPQLAEFLKDAEESIRHFAAETLGGLANKDAAGAAASKMSDTNAGVRRAALLALGRCGSPGRPWAADVVPYLNDSDFPTRLAAIQALGDLGASSEAPALGALASDLSKAARQAAVTACAKLGAAGAEQALLFLDDTDPAVRQAAVRVFSPLHSKLPASCARLHIQALACKLLDEDWRVRLAVVVALGDLAAQEMVEEVAALRGDENEQVRRSAVVALEKLRAPPALVATFLGDPDREVRADAERAFVTLGGTRGGHDDGELSEAD